MDRVISKFGVKVRPYGARCRAASEVEILGLQRFYWKIK
jgi:hypothetical protein